MAAFSIRFGTQTLVFFREDLVNKLLRNCVHPPGDETDSGAGAPSLSSHVLTPIVPRICIPSYPCTLVPSYPRTFIPSYLHTLVPSYPRTLVPSYPRTLVPSYPGFVF